MPYPSSPRPRKRRFLPIVLVIAALFIGWRIFFGAPAQQGMPDGPMKASVAEAVTKNITMWKEFSGRLEPVNIAEVRARVSGNIEQIFFKDGAMVSNGQPTFPSSNIGLPRELGIVASSAVIPALTAMSEKPFCGESRQDT